METFFSFLEKRIDDCSSFLCVGLDPHPADLPEPTAAAARDFCLRLIHSTARYAAAFKPNAAFFELYGSSGWSALKEVILAVREESERLGSRIPVILDAKRGDIASTAQAYARSAFEELGAHAITLNPYLGRDALEPFLSDPERGVFLLCKTSNPGAADLQDLQVRGADGSFLPLYLQVARLAEGWNTAGNIGLVVGATQVDALAAVRAAARQLWMLVPGVGTQGGDLEFALRAGLREDGRGLLINVSRGLARAEDPGQVAAALRDEMFRLAHTIRRDARAGSRSRPETEARERIRGLADDLLDAGCIQFGEFTLKSGLKSPFYIDLRRIVSYPSLLDQVSAAYLPLLAKLDFQRIAGLPYAALPIATAISLKGNLPLIYPRREAKDYGTRAEIEGVFQAGETVVVIDDLATTGASKFEAIEKLSAAGLRVRDVVVLIDRQSGAKEALEHAGLRLHSVVTIRELLDAWESTGRVPAGRIEASRAFLDQENASHA